MPQVTSKPAMSTLFPSSPTDASTPCIAFQVARPAILAPLLLCAFPTCADKSAVFFLQTQQVVKNMPNVQPTTATKPSDKGSISHNNAPHSPSVQVYLSITQKIFVMWPSEIRFSFGKVVHGELEAVL